MLGAAVKTGRDYAISAVAPAAESAGLRELGEVCLGERLLVRVAAADHALLQQLLQRAVHRLHAQGGTALHDVLELIELAVADQVGDGRRVDEDLERRDAPCAARALHELLRDDAAQ